MYPIYYDIVITILKEYCSCQIHKYQRGEGEDALLEGSRLKLEYGENGWRETYYYSDNTWARMRKFMRIDLCSA